MLYKEWNDALKYAMKKADELKEMGYDIAIEQRVDVYMRGVVFVLVDCMGVDFSRYGTATHSDFNDLIVDIDLTVDMILYDEKEI